MYGAPGGSPDGNNFKKGQKPDGQPPSDTKSGRGELFEGIEESLKKEAMAILEKERSGELTEEQAQQQLAELGVEIPQRPTDKK